MDARSGRFPLVDSLRAIAALAVLMHHVGGFSGAFNVPVVDWYLLQFQAGVALFFCISGFLLYRPFATSRLASRPSPRTDVYAWRRFLRIVPAYWVVLTVLALTVAPEVRDQPLLYYGFAQVYDAAHALDGLDVAWTLCVEVAFYAMLPLYALAMRALPARDRAARLRWEVTGLVALVVAGLGFRLWGLDGHEHFGGVAVLFTLPAFLDWFALGMGLAVLSAWLATGDRDRLPRAIAWIDRWPGLSWLLALGSFSVAAWAFHELPDPSVQLNIVLHVAWAGTGVFMLAPAVLGDGARGAVRWVLALPALAWLGLISYGIYLWQRPMIRFVDDAGILGDPNWLDPNLLWAVLVLPLTIAAAAFSYYLVERPALTLKRLVSPRGAQPDQPGAVSAPSVPETHRHAVGRR